MALALEPTALSRPGHTTSDNVTTVEVETLWAAGLASDLETLTETSTHVFVGTVGSSNQRLEPRHEDVANVADSGKPFASPDSFPITTYQVTVSSITKGDLSPGKSVEIDQPGGLVTEDHGRQVRYLLEGDLPLESGASYLFFARINANGSLSSAPFARFEIVDGVVSGSSSWTHTGAIAEIGGLSIAEALREVEVEAR